MQTQEKIMVVDDDRNITALLQEVLSEDGFQVLCAYSGQEALDMAKIEMPALIIADALLPKMNGFELVTKLRATEHGNKTPIIMVSGIYKALRMSEQIRELEINEFIEKPFDIKELLTKIKQLLQVSIQQAAQPAEFFSHQGEIKQQGVPRLLYLLYRQRENGQLFLIKDKLKKKISIKNGEPYFVESNLVQECLGRLLVKQGKLTPEQCEESLALMRSKKTKQGETLIQMGLLSPNDLDEALREQARQKLYDIFVWDSGQYHFMPGNKFPAELTRIDLTLPQLMVRGVRNGFALERLKQEMDVYLEKDIHLTENHHLKFEDFRLATWDERIVNEIREGKKMKDLLASKAAREVDIYQLIYVFFKTDMIQFNESEAEKQEKSTINRLLHQLDGMKQRDYFAMLGVNAQADEKQLFLALSQKMAQYHPTTSALNPGKSEKVRALLVQISDLLQKAHQTLANREKRQSYEKELFFTKGVIPAKAAEVFNADEELRHIRNEMGRGSFEQAGQIAKSMSLLFSKEMRFPIYRGWALFKHISQKGNPTDSALKECLNFIANALRQDPTYADGYFYLGSIYKFQEDVENAMLFFNKAIEMNNGHHVEAERELRLLQMRSNKKNKSLIKWK